MANRMFWRGTVTLFLVGCQSTGPNPSSRLEPVPPAGGSDDAVVAGRDVVDDVDDIPRVLAQLADLQRRTRSDPTLTPAARVERMVSLGMWDEAERELQSHRPLSGDLLLAEAHLKLKQHRYREAGARVASVLARDRDHRPALILAARLQIQAWDLTAAERTARTLLDTNPRDEVAGLLVGRIHLLRKDYEEALAWAQRVQGWNSNNAAAWALEAETRFWTRDLDSAVAPLRRALAIDPFDPDARFNYGYAIWRRVDATLLDAMAAHWEIALTVDPRHYQTHWHWGNGHTNLTYADYAHPTDSVVRARLRPADQLVRENRLRAAITLSREVEEDYPQSVLPAMLRGSVFYMAYDLYGSGRLDSAATVFADILTRKPHYGPAHNGLAAVIKQRQFMQLVAYDSLETAIAATPEPTGANFARVFPDAAYYPGPRVAKMIHRQLGPSRAYLPMLARLNRTFAIPPLHRDLADAMGAPSFRTTTTFDNRQWMDIRGVGSGATGIEYVERGAHWERNVLAHEYVHLFHGGVFTDAENRRTRALYYQAMDQDRTLDYYAANNESEFLAQAYPAYMAPVKVHPLNHKSMNTRADLERRDPDTFRFVSDLMARQQAYLDGDSTALAGNWAEVFIALSVRERRDLDSASEFATASALLDTALMWDPRYLPAFLSYAALHRTAGRLSEAEGWLDRAAGIDSSYAPLFTAQAELIAARFARGDVPPAGALAGQIGLLHQSLQRETDLSLRASLNRQIRETHREFAQYDAALDAALTYWRTGPTVSTYLRDRRDDAGIFAHVLRSDIGYSTEVLPFFTDLVAQKPQHVSLRSAYADALAGAGRVDEAVTTLEELQTILRAGGRPNRTFAVQLAELHLRRGDTTLARREIDALDRQAAGGDEADARYVRVVATLGEPEMANRWLQTKTDDPERRSPASEAELQYTRGWVAESQGQLEVAVTAYRQAVEANPYHRDARVGAIRTASRLGQGRAARDMERAGLELPLPMGPDYRRAAETARTARR